MATLGQTTRLCLVVTADAGAAARERLSAALGVSDIASVTIAASPGRPLDAATARPLVDIAQRAGAAALLADDARLARTLKADGVHLTVCDKPLAAFEEAREILGRGAIVGIDAGRSRHDAMALAEAGADYIGFGVPSAVREQETAREHRLDLIAWWAEIFEPPCVALDVASPEEASALAHAGADFLVVTIPDGAALAEVRDLTAAFARAIEKRAPVQ